MRLRLNYKDKALWSVWQSRKVVCFLARFIEQRAPEKDRTTRKLAPAIRENVFIMESLIGKGLVRGWRK
jgi:hypothetical protein